MASLTLTRLRAQVAFFIGSSTVSGSDEETIVTELLNEGYEDVIVQTHCSPQRASIALTAAEQEYRLPTQALAILEYSSNASSQNYPMERATLQEMMALRRSGSSASGVRYYTVKGSNFLEVWPPPASGETLTVYYIPRPTALSAGSDVPSDIPSEFHQLLRYYACWQMAMADENRPSSFGAVYLGLYERDISRLKAANNRKGGNRQARARVGRTRSTRSADPSVYP